MVDKLDELGGLNIVFSGNVFVSSRLGHKLTLARPGAKSSERSIGVEERRYVVFSFSAFFH